MIDLQSASWAERSGALNTAADTLAKRRGLKYQKKVERALERLFEDRILFRPWINYVTRSGAFRRCQPDAVLYSPKVEWINIIEIKYSTMVEAWDQLNGLYKPVLSKLYSGPIYLTLITRMFDPHVQFPVEVIQLEGLERLNEWNVEGLGVVSWK